MSEFTPPDFSVDLHAHTTRSDGNDSPAELLENAASLGMKVIAMTDHDILPPDDLEKNGAILSVGGYADELGIGVMRGIEVSCDTSVDDVHIVGFGCDWHSPVVQWLPEIAVESKKKSYRLLVERLCGAGMKLDWNDLFEDGARKEDSIQKKHIFELIAKKGYAPSWQAAKIMVRDNPEYDVKREKPDPVKTIESLHAAGGIAILAHPYLIDERVVLQGEPVTRDAYIRFLIDAGLDGIESRYTYDKTSYKGTKSPDEIQREVEERYGASVAIISGGSDYHADHKKGVSNPRRIGDAGISLKYFLQHSVLAGSCEGRIPSEL